jgi:hypothetical protein
MIFFKQKWQKVIAFAIIGGGLGFAYYYFIGCLNGSCPLSSNPFLTTGYGLGAGILMAWDTKKNNNKQEE